MTAATPAAGDLFLREAREQLSSGIGRVRHCLGQLDDSQIWWRPEERMNSVGNLVLHLVGNLRQRILSLLGGQPDDRDRPREFSERQVISGAELQRRLDEVARQADEVLAGLAPAVLLETRTYQAMGRQVESSVLAILLQTLIHLGGHSQEIIYMTRLQRGSAYHFLLG